MFHHSTTIHHRQQFSFTVARENRLVHVSTLRDWHVKSAAYMQAKPVRAAKKALHYYSWAFGIPPMKKAFSYTLGGADRVLSGAEWSLYTGIEASKGALQMTAAPAAMVAYSAGAVLPKRMLVDVPWATFKASVLTPIGILKAPINFASGVWESVTKTREQAGNVLNSMMTLNPLKIYQSTRQAVSEILVNPISKPLKPIVDPVFHLADTALGAEAQILSTIFDGAPQMVGQGFNRFVSAPATGESIRLEKQGIRDAKREKDRQEEEARKQAFQDAVDAERGEEKKAA